MKTASSALIAMLDENNFIMADLYTLTLIDGSNYYFADYDFDLILSGNTFVSSLEIFTRGKITLQVGTQVDTLEVDISSVNTLVLAGGATITQMAHNGGLDGARVRVERVFLPPTNPTDTSAGSVFLFDGRVSEVDCTRHTVTLQVNSDLELLNIQMPRNLYQSSCMHALYDSGCTVNQAAFTVTGALTSGSTLSALNTNLTQAAGYFSQGVITFTSGVNTGVRRTVRSYSGGVIALTLPLKALPATGDTFTAYAGCDNTQATCQTKFNNLQNFRGFPYIPVPETAT